MNKFTYQYPVKVHFGEQIAKSSLLAELDKYGKNILLAYGGGSVKRTGIYDEIISILREAGKTVTEFSGIMSNPTYKKVQEGVTLVRKNNIDFIFNYHENVGDNMKREDIEQKYREFISELLMLLENSNYATFVRDNQLDIIHNIGGSNYLKFDFAYYDD